MVRRRTRLVIVLSLVATCLASLNPDGKPSTLNTASVTDAKQASKDIETIDKKPRKSIPATPSKQKSEKSKRVTRQVKSTTKTSAPVSSAASASLRRIKKEYKDAVQMGICYDWVKERPVTSSSTQTDTPERQILCLGPLASNLRHWHFSFRGVQDSLYESGIYHGRIMLPKDYPLTPPRVQLWTPSGRFRPFVDICLSASAYHPESWTPRWTVLSLVQALRIHMLTNPQEIGGMTSSRDETLEHSRKSLSWGMTWRAGKLIVRVDHMQLLSQGVLNDTSPMEDDPIANGPPETQSPEEPILVDEADTPPDSDAGQPTFEVTETTTKPKKKRKKKRSRVELEEVTVKRAPSLTRSISRIVFLSISQLFATPARIAVVSFMMLLWILRIPK